MMEKIFSGMFETAIARTIPVWQFLLCIAVALIIGVIMGLSYTYKTRHTKSFVVTLSLLPAVVAVVIMMVNGNVGAGVAVAGAFSLVRFRSVPGTAREIVAIFLAMGAGLIVGMGYLAYAVLFSLVLSLAFMLFTRLSIASSQKRVKYRTVRITVPEELDYTGVFEEVLSSYTDSCELTQVKTTNMGSMLRLTYEVVMKPDANEKRMIDEIRVRNANLEVLVAKQDSIVTEL